MTVQQAPANGITLAYETFGDPADPPVLLVMGLGTQMLAWPQELCELIAARGHHVIRFDNRDIGMSTHLDHLPTPDPLAVASHRRAPAYRLEDMAADTIGLIEAIGRGPVHLVGASMGGFISQIVALERPDLVRTLTLIMTSTGSRRVGLPRRATLMAVLRRRPAGDRAGAVAASGAMLRQISSPGFDFEEELVRSYAESAYDRGYDAAGQRRQLGAVVAQSDRTERLGAITAPTLVIHGLSDPLVSPTGGLALARAIPGARLIGFHGMGHDLPRPLWPELAEAIGGLAARAALTPPPTTPRPLPAGQTAPPPRG